MNKGLSGLSLESLIATVQKNRVSKKVFNKIGHSEKAILCIEAIKKLNSDHNTSFYLDRKGRTFLINGHREYGNISKRTGIIGQDITMTLGGSELKHITNHTIKMIIDSIGNYIIISITKMKEYGYLDNLAYQKCIKTTSGQTFYSWSLEELDRIGAILYKSI